METTRRKQPKDLDINKFLGAKSLELLEAVQIMQGYLHFKGNIDLDRMESFVEKYQK